MCSSSSPSKPKKPIPVEEPDVQLGVEKKVSRLRKRRSGGTSSLRTGLNIGGGGGRTGLSIPK